MVLLIHAMSLGFGFNSIKTGMTRSLGLMMSDSRTPYDDEIDLFELIETLWQGKVKILAATLATSLAGIGYVLLKPASFQMSMPIAPQHPSIFLEYASINDALKPLGYSIDSESVFQLFLTEYGDYDEMVAVLESDALVQQKLAHLENEEKQKKLIGFAKDFIVTPPAKAGESGTATAKWSDKTEGLRLFSLALEKTLINVKKKISHDIRIVSESLTRNTNLKLEDLRMKAELATKSAAEKIDQKLQFLKEQSAIAKELGIETNRLDAGRLSTPQTNGVSLSISSNEVPFYLRGFKAIDKEISLLKGRSKQQISLMSDEYLAIKAKIAELEKDVKAEQLRKMLTILDKDSPNQWIKYDPRLAESKPQKKSGIIVTLSVFVGGMIGGFYALLSSAIKKRKTKVALV